MKKLWMIVGFVFIALLLVFQVTPAGRSIWNQWFFKVQKADDATRYETLKKVEDTARAMQASYEADKLIYEQYKNSDNEEKRNWAEQAKMRANKTAATYNKFILENSFIWQGNIPKDIKNKLEYLEE